ncbi:hypothetical protein [Nostoc sp. 106C]|nr:hypothetical protein [Nostoc sp. 106C]
MRETQRCGDAVSPVLRENFQRHLQQERLAAQRSGSSAGNWR